MRTGPFTIAGMLPIALPGAAAMPAPAGCGESQLSTGLSNNPPSAIGGSQSTPIAKCITESNTDVISGGSRAKPDCANVVMVPSQDTSEEFNRIRVDGGGSLTVSGGEGSEAPIREIRFMNGGAASFGMKR